MSRTFGEGQLGQIVYGGTRYQITWDDLLWAARMIEGESGNDLEDAANVLWAQTQRMAIFHSTNFTRLIQAQSQPINPKWREDGEFCRPGGRWSADERRCGPAQLERRRQLAEKPWEQISSARQDLVYNWATARLPNRVEKAIDFAQPGAASHHRGAAGLAERGLIYVYDKLNRGPESIEDRGNVYYANQRSNEWEPQYVKVIFNGTSSELAAPAPQTTTITTTAQHSTASFDRTIRITSNRTSPPNNLYNYYILSASATDPQTNNIMTEADEEIVIKTNYDRFFDQVNALKAASSLEMAKVLPLLTIFGEDESGNIVNLSEQIFSQPTFHNIFNDSSDFNAISNAEFPERPLASLESLTVDVQTPSVGGTTEITIVNLKIKIHSPSLVTTNHPKGKFISYMLRPGYNLRIRYGVTSEAEQDQNAFQWKEQGFFTSQYNMTVNDDKTINLQIQLLPNMQKLMNQVLIGESIPSSDISSITEQDVNNVIDSITTGEDLSQGQVDEIRRRINQFANQFNSSVGTPALRTQAFSGTFGSTLQGAIRTSQILNRDGGIDATAVVLDNTTEAVASIQSLLLTRRYESLIRRDAYRHTLPNTTPIYAINCGPLVYNLVRPEIEMIVQYASENNMQIGEVFSIDAGRVSDSAQRRNNVTFIFGNFNNQAGQFAGKPISTFPVNVESIFSYLRERRLIGEFSNNINGFFNNIASIINDPVNYNVSRSDGGATNWPLEVPQIKCLFYPDPRPERTDNWIFYIYDNKAPIVEFRSLLERLNNQELPTKEDIIEACTARRIPWIEMGTEGNFVKTMAAQTQADDLLQSHNIISANRSARRIDASEVPPGVFADWWSSNESETSVTNQVVIIPFSVRATTFMLSTAFLFSPIYIFFPIPEYSGVFMPYILGHEIKNGAAITNMDLQINVTRANRRQT